MLQSSYFQLTQIRVSVIREIIVPPYTISMNFTIHSRRKYLHLIANQWCTWETKHLMSALTTVLQILANTALLCHAYEQFGRIWVVKGQIPQRFFFKKLLDEKWCNLRLKNFHTPFSNFYTNLRLCVVCSRICDCATGILTLHTEP